jgi:hypothetical protein
MNSFGTSSIKCPLYDPQSARLDRQRFRRDAIPALARANSVYVPTGEHPLRGWLLLSRGDYNKLSRYSTTFQLEIGDPRSANNVSTLQNLSIVQAQCVTRGIAADDNALYLVEITDGRGIVCNQWFQFPLTTWYNVRAPAYREKFYDSSMNGGTSWTWTTMVQDIWNRMSAFLGTWPGFPSGFTHPSTPEGWWFTGVSAWSALNAVLDQLGVTIAHDPTSTTPYTIVRPGNSDTSFSNLTTKYTTNLEDDQEWIDVGAGRVPAQVVVLFRRRNQVYGSEETVFYGNNTLAKQWAMVPIYSVTVNAPSTFTGAVGTHYLWSDFTVRHDMDSNPLAADITTANALAQDQVGDYFATNYWQTLGYMSRTYAGALPFVTGSQVDGVCWYQDYSGQDQQGWKTKIVRGPNPPFPGIWCC